MGVVYAAYDPQLDRKVALKILREGVLPEEPADEGRARLLREARAMARLAHPNVVAVFDAGVLEEHVFIAMEFVDGLTLRRWLAEKARSAREVLDVFVQAGRGLSAAHAAGLVHRDFKPDNVLIDGRGRVRVTDFGLARPIRGQLGSLAEPPTSPGADRRPGEAGAGDASGPAEGARVNWTASGALVGTPAYMSPEQITRRGADHRTDQFSFCVALFEALHGVLPFEGQTVAAVAFAITMGRVRALPKGSQVPAWIAPVLTRGLAVRPEERHRSMDALLAELSRDPARRRRGLAAAAVVLAAAAGATGYAALAARSPGAAACKDAPRRLAGVWDAERRRAIETVFQATRLPYAVDAARGAASALDRYAASWEAMHTEACEATRVRGDQPEVILALRMRCLERRLSELSNLTALFSRADAQVVERAVPAAQSIRSVAGCADTEALSAMIELPADPKRRGAVEAVRRDVGEAKALLDVGRYEKGLEIITAAAVAAGGLDYPPALAEALNVKADLEAKTRDPKLAERTLYEAIVAAEAGRHEVERSRGWTQLVKVVGILQGRYDDGLRLVALAEAVVGRLGKGRDAIRADLWTIRGMIMLEQGHHREATVAFRSALALRQEANLPEDRAAAVTLSNLGGSLETGGAWHDAQTYYQQALSILERAYGPSHPELITPLSNSCMALLTEGRLGEAQATCERALQIRDAVFGGRNQRVSVLANLSLVFGERGKMGEALRLARSAVALQLQGAEHVDLAYYRADLALALRGRGEVEAAMPEARLALALAEKIVGREHPLTAVGLTLVAICAQDQRAFAAALPLHRRALEIRERAFGPDHFTVAVTLTEMGRTLLGLKKYAEAIPHLERALTIRRGLQIDPSLPAETAFMLARALWAARRDRDEALRLAEGARAGYARSESYRRREAADVEVWLAGKTRT
jgi:tetratricopeptide (TPR) repeat protein